jgi:hypothetical protein
VNALRLVRRNHFKKLLINSLDAVPTGATVLRQAQHERENRGAFGSSSVHPERVEGWLANFSTASKRSFLFFQALGNVARFLLSEGEENLRCQTLTL